MGWRNVPWYYWGSITGQTLISNLKGLEELPFKQRPEMGGHGRVGERSPESKREYDASKEPREVY